MANRHLVRFTSVLALAASLATVVLVDRAAALPAWVLRPPEDRENYYFVGVRTGAPSLEEGRQGAYNAALGEIAKVLGSRIMTRTAIALSEVGARIRSEIESQSEGNVAGQHLVEMATEQNDGKFDVYVLVRYPRAEIEAERNRLDQIEKNRQAAIGTATSAARSAELAGDVPAALRGYRDALRLIDRTAEPEAWLTASERMSGAIRSIGMEFEVPRKVVKATVANSPATIRLIQAGSRQPLKNFPVKVRLVGGTGAIPASLETDAAGICAVPLKGLSPVGRLELQAVPDLDRLAPGLAGEEASEVRSRVGGVSASLDLLVVPAFTERSYHFKTRIGGEALPDVVSRVRETLEECGYVEVAPEFEADLTVELALQTRKPSHDEANAMYIAEGRAEVALLDEAAGRRLGTVTVAPIKAFGDSEGRASDKLGIYLGKDLAARLKQFVDGQRIRQSEDPSK